MPVESITKDPHAVLDYVFNWSDWLQDGDTIVSRVVTVGTGITKDSDSESAGIVTIWLSGGTHGSDYLVACEITTTLGRTDERTMNIRCRDR